MKLAKLYVKIALISVFVLSGCDSRPSAPSIVFEEISWDFGEIDGNSNMSHEFVFRNIGKSSLEILKVKPSCGCLAVEFPENEIQPGDTGKIVLKIDLAKSITPQQSYAIVSTNDPVKREIPLSVQGRILPEIMVNPQKIDFGDIGYGSIIYKKFEVMIPNRSRDNVFLSSELKTETGFLGVTTKIVDQKITETQYGWIKVLTCEIGISPETNFGTFKDVLEIQHHDSIIKLPFTGVIKGHIKIVPESLFVNLRKPDTVWEKVLDITYMSDESFSISEIKTKNEGIENELRRVKDNHYRLKIKVNSDRLVNGLLDDEIVVISNDKLQPCLKIPVKGWIRK